MSLTVSVEGGLVEGVRVGDVLNYRGIPYAEARRFGAPGPVSAWASPRDGSRSGPICPQPPSPLAAVMGEPPPMPHDEACLTLNVSTPAATSTRPRPVMVWLHGGAYAVSAGSHEWYHPDHLVSEGDVVVVSVNYRLGVFGYLRLEGVSEGNLGLLDQIAALRWVAKNIAEFGGDPDSVTVFGESAGGHSIAALMSTQEARGLFRRAIIQSAHLGLGFTRQAIADRVGRSIYASLGGVEPRHASAEQLVAAHRLTIAKFRGPGGINTAPIFGPVAGVAPLPAPAQADIAKAILPTSIDLLIGSTREEMRAFFDSNPSVVRLRNIPVVGNSGVNAVAAAVTRRVFAEPARKLADVQSRSGAAVYRYEFAWTPPREAFGACHTIELPFLFGNEVAWRDAPMLGGASWESVDALGKRVRRAWTRFARSGNPNSEADPPWPQHVVGADVGMRFR